MPFKKTTSKKKAVTSRDKMRKYAKKRQTVARSSLVKMIRNVSAQQVETKMVTYNSALAIYHNLSSRYGGNLLGTVQGIADATGASARIGDTINLRGLKFLMQFRQPADRPNVNWKVWIIKVKGNPSTPASVPVKAITGNLMLDPIDTEKCVLIRQLTFKHPDNYWQGTAGTSKETCFFRKVWLPLRGKYVYSGDNADTGRDYQIYMFVTAYDTTGSLITDNIGTFQCSNMLYFKDP